MIPPNFKKNRNFDINKKNRVEYIKYKYRILLFLNISDIGFTIRLKYQYILADPR